MSTFAKVLCLFLVASPLTHADESYVGSYAEKANTMIKAIEKQYKIAKSYVDAVVSHINFEAPLQSDSSLDVQRPSAECYNFLSERIRTSRLRVIECSAGGITAASEQRDRLQKTFEDSVAGIQAHTCLSMVTIIRYQPGAINLIRSTCRTTFNRDMLQAESKAKTAFSEIAANASRVLYNWIKTTGRCLANSEEPSHEVEWRRACQNDH